MVWRLDEGHLVKLGCFQLSIDKTPINAGALFDKMGLLPNSRSFLALASVLSFAVVENVAAQNGNTLIPQGHFKKYCTYINHTRTDDPLSSLSGRDQLQLERQAILLPLPC